MAVSGYGTRCVSYVETEMKPLIILSAYSTNKHNDLLGIV